MKPPATGPDRRTDRPGLAVDFDDFVVDYARQVDRVVAFSGQTQEFFLDAEAGQLAAEVRRRGFDAPTVRALEVGCGAGLMQRWLRGRIGRLWGLDIALGCLAKTGRAGNRAKLVAADGRRSPFADSSFDLVFAVCVLHHLPPAGRDAMVGEMVRRGWRAAEGLLAQLPLGAQFLACGIKAGGEAAQHAGSPSVFRSESDRTS